MPRLPDYTDLGERPVPGAVRPMGPVANTSRAEVLGDFAKMAEAAVREQETAAVFEAKRQLDDWEREAIYGQNGAVNRLGKDALEIPKTVPAQFDEFVGKLQPKLQTPKAQQAFAEVVASRRAQIGDWAARHALQQRKVYEQGQVEADVDSSVNRAVTLAMSGDAANSAAEMKVGQTRLVGYMRSQGRSEEEIGAEVGKLTGRIGAALARGHIEAGRLEEAGQVLARDGAAIPLEQRATLTRALDEANMLRQSQQVADELFAKHAGDIGAALKVVREKYSGKAEDALVTRLKTLDAERVALRERAQKDAADQAWRIYESTGSLGKVPATLLAEMDGRDVSALRRAAKADANAAADRRDVKTDPNVYYALSMMAAAEPDKFKGQDLRQFFDKLSPTDRKHFIDRQSIAVNKPDAFAEVSTLEQQKSAMVKALKLDKNDAGLFYQMADKSILARQQEMGRKLTQDERQKELDRLVLQGDAEGSWFKTRQFKAMAEGRKFTPKWDETQRRQAIQALQRRGVSSPSDAQVNAVLTEAYGMRDR